MRRIIAAGLFIVLGGLPLALADTVYDNSVQQLQWLDSTSPYQSFIHDRNSGRLRFYAVNGYAKEIVGVGELNFARSYEEVELTTIEGTSDNILSKEHGRLISLAYDFAFKYNSLMKQYADSIGKRDCAPQTDWDAMFTAVTNKVWGPMQDEGSVTLNEAGPPILGIDLKDLNRTNEILEFTCKAVQDQGIDEIVSVEVYKRMSGPGFAHQKFKEFKCFKGNIAPR